MKCLDMPHFSPYTVKLAKGQPAWIYRFCQLISMARNRIVAP
uniref:Uncharacterized protein n=1 Tax=Klebsiella pneumoniae TaxID=573 RepID=A0A6M3HB04_KLEPN|nr:hypothetical protein [Klebsiella pneumoniae]